MSNKSKKDNLTNILLSLSETSDGNTLKISDIIGAMEHRGFGPLLMAPALLIILPSGAIPGMPAVCGLLIIMSSVQILFGKKSPWVPTKIGNFTVSIDKFKSFSEKLKPYTQIIDRYVENRFEFLSVNIYSKRLVAIICTLLAIAIITIGIVPMVPAFLALPILFFALGLSVKDGILIAICYLASIGVIIIFTGV